MADRTGDRHRGFTTKVAQVSAALGILVALGVQCSHFHEQPTSAEVRWLRSEDTARHLQRAGWSAAVVTGALAVLLGHARPIALLGLCTSGLALGGVGVSFEPIMPTSQSLGLDRFVLSHLSSTRVFLPIEPALPLRAAS